MRNEEVVTLEPARQRDFTVIKNIYDHKKVGDILTTAECKLLTQCKVWEQFAMLLTEAIQTFLWIKLYLFIYSYSYSFIYCADSVVQRKSQRFITYNKLTWLVRNNKQICVRVHIRGSWSGYRRSKSNYILYYWNLLLSLTTEILYSSVKENTQK